MKIILYYIVVPFFLEMKLYYRLISAGKFFKNEYNHHNVTHSILVQFFHFIFIPLSLSL